MKKNKWILPAVCSCAAFFVGLITGLSLAGQKKKADVEHVLDSVNEESSDEVEEECPDE